MAIRRQGWTVEWDDDGSVPVADLTKLYTGESVFYDNPGATNSLTSRNRTKDDQFIVQVISGSQIKLTKVKVAEETANYARVIEGITSGMTVVARFDKELENNQKVIIK